MPDVYTGTSALTTDVATAWSTTTYKALRPQLYWDRFATEKGTTQHDAAAIAFTLWTDLAAATTALSEAADVDAVPLATSTVSVTLVEYGNAAIPTAKVRATSFINIDPDVANIVGFNAGVSLDTIVRDVAVAGTNVIYGSGGTDTPTTRGGVGTGIDADDTLSLDDIRLAVARLRTANVMNFDGDSYAGIIHPHVSYDLRSETGLTHFSDPVAYSDPERRWNGEIGKVEGVRFMESPRAGLVANAGDGGAVDVYQTMIFGREGIAKAWSNGGGYDGGANPTIVIADKADNLNRFRAVGWKWLGGYGILRQDALQRIETSSSIGANT